MSEEGKEARKGKVESSEKKNREKRAYRRKGERVRSESGREVEEIREEGNKGKEK